MATKITWVKNSIIPALIIGLLLRLPGMFESLWYDEAFTLYLATLDIPHLIAATAGDVHPPLWYLISWASCRVFGFNEFAVRFPSLVFGLATIALFPRVLALFNVPDVIATIGKWLVVSSPMLINYSVEARMYSLLALLCLLGIYAAQRRNWPALALIITAGMYTQNMFVLILPTLALLAGFEVIALAGAFSILLYTPWIPVVLSQTTNVAMAYWIPDISLGRVAYTVYRIIAGAGHHEGIVLITAPLVLIILATGAWQARDNWRLLAWALLPPALAGIISLVQPVMIERILIGAVPGLLVLCGWGVYSIITRLNNRWYALTPALIWIITIGGLYLTPTNSDLRSRYQSLDIQPGDVCYHLNASTLITTAYVHPDCKNYLWPADQGLDQTITRATKQAMGMAEAEIETLPAGPIWLFHYTGPHVSGPEFEEQHRILENFRIIDTQLVQDDDGIALTTVWRIANDNRYASR